MGSRLNAVLSRRIQLETKALQTLITLVQFYGGDNRQQGNRLRVISWKHSQQYAFRLGRALYAARSIFMSQLKRNMHIFSAARMEPSLGCPPALISLKWLATYAIAIRALRGHLSIGTSRQTGSSGTPVLLWCNYRYYFLSRSNAQDQSSKTFTYFRSF